MMGRKRLRQLFSIAALMATLLSLQSDRYGLNPYNVFVTARRIAPDTSAKNSIGRFAYSFVIGGCDPDQPHRYRGYVYNILVSARMLQNLGSQADVVAFFQISSKSNATGLPKDDTRPLEALRVQIRYLPKTATESFYEAQMNKFTILKLAKEHDRVIFMDGDVLPLTNMDYLFELSMRGVIQPNLVVAAPQSPSNGGFFMLAPVPGDYELVQQIIQERETKVFDPVRAWGHAIQPPDKWRTRSTSGTNFTYYGANADQGLCE